MAAPRARKPVLIVTLVLLLVVLAAMLGLQMRELSIAKKCVEIGAVWNDALGICEPSNSP